MGGIDEIPQGGAGTARLLLNPQLPVSGTLSEHDKFLLGGSAAMVEITPLAVYISLRPTKRNLNNSEQNVWTAEL